MYKRLLYACSIIILVTVVLFLYLFFTSFERALRMASEEISINRLGALIPVLPDVQNEELAAHMYNYDNNHYSDAISAKEDHWINTGKEGKLPVFVSGTFVFVVLHKSKNFCAGCAYDVKGGYPMPSIPGLNSETISKNRFIWKYSL